MSMSFQAEAGLVERVRAWLDERRTIAREMAELRQCGRDELEAMARDAGANSAEDLVDMVRRGPASAELMSRLAAALDIPIEDVRKRDGALVRELEVCCSHCQDKARCRSELAAGTAADHFGEFCPNAATLAGLRA